MILHCRAWWQSYDCCLISSGGSTKIENWFDCRAPSTTIPDQLAHQKPTATHSQDWIALIEHGDSAFLDKVRNPQYSGAPAVIVSNISTRIDGLEAQLLENPPSFWNYLPFRTALYTQIDPHAIPGILLLQALHPLDSGPSFTPDIDEQDCRTVEKRRLTPSALESVSSAYHFLRVAEGSPAAEARIEPFFAYIVGIGGKQKEDGEQLATWLDKAKGKSITLHKVSLHFSIHLLDFRSVYMFRQTADRVIEQYQQHFVGLTPSISGLYTQSQFIDRLTKDLFPSTQPNLKRSTTDLGILL
ncbi:hypothetical protein PGTUg99_007761 [Puccinia graminis f. sp. tritici]|uniref:Uncharacterized protein n=1 Tax=Puccinia graminis f. sp. tritici TaxID=56615 RepID=A0A5B0R5C3_PUCGR|nr:hypothetical protein PGTUg99_007761 [Puccinia graminis f. sp. tritici]